MKLPTPYKQGEQKTLICKGCGETVPRLAVNQERCTPCAKAKRNADSHKWKKDNDYIRPSRRKPAEPQHARQGKLVIPRHGAGLLFGMRLEKSSTTKIENCSGGVEEVL